MAAGHEELTSTTDKILTDLSVEKRHKVTELAATTDFSMFECVDMDVTLEQHRKTPLRRGSHRLGST